MRRRCTLFGDRVPEGDSLAGDGPAVIDRVLEDQSLLGSRGGPVPSPQWVAVAWTDPADPAPIGDRSWLVETTIAGDPDRGPEPVKMVSFVAALASLSQAGFAERYRAHRTVAAAHHGTSAYHQNLLVDPADGVSAVSELVFTDRRAYLDDFYLLPESRQVVADDVRGFIHLRGSRSMLVAETVVRA